MAESTEQRAYHLIEDIRADIDFELDDVIANIVRHLPEEYFERLKRADQITHLKALLAINICQLNDEILMRSADNRHVAVVGRRDFPGLLANILERLPRDRALIDAKIFTSKTNDFIIDLFEFESPDSFADSDSFDSYAVESSIESVAKKTNFSRQEVSDFAAHYPRNSRVLAIPEELTNHFLTYQEVEKSNGVAVNLRPVNSSEMVNVTVATNSLMAREVVERSACYLGNQEINIHQAFLNDLVFSGSHNVAICSFVVSGNPNETVLEKAVGIGEFLRGSVCD